MIDDRLNNKLIILIVLKRPNLIYQLQFECFLSNISINYNLEQLFSRILQTNLRFEVHNFSYLSASCLQVETHAMHFFRMLWFKRRLLSKNSYVVLLIKQYDEKKGRPQPPIWL